LQSFGQFTGWGGEILSLFQYRGHLYFSVGGQGTYRVNQEKTISKVSDMAIGWFYIVWNGYVYWTEQGGDVYRFDGSSHKVVFTHSSTNARLSSFAVYDVESRLYVTGMGGIGAYTADGVTWVEDTVLPGVATPSTLYALGALGDDLYAMAQVYGNDIIRKASGGTWTSYRDYTGRYRRSPMWETPFNRQNFPLNDLVGERLWCGSHEGNAYTWDGTTLLKAFESYRPRQFVTDDGLPLVIVKPIVVEGWLFLVVGSGSLTQSGGELWLWDGLQFYRVLTLPFRITSVELFLGQLWVGGNTATMAMSPWTAEGTLSDTQRRYTSNWGYLVSLPLDILNQKELPPQRRRVWVDEPVSAGATVYSDSDGGALIPSFGYERKTVFVYNTEGCTLDIELDPDGSGTYYSYITGAAVDAATPYWAEIEHDAAFVRLKLIQGASDGEVHAVVNLSN